MHLGPGAVGARPQARPHEHAPLRPHAQRPHAPPSMSPDDHAGRAGPDAAQPELEAYAVRRDPRPARDDAEWGAEGLPPRQRAEPPGERVVADRAQALAAGGEPIVARAAAREERPGDAVRDGREAPLAGDVVVARPPDAVVARDVAGPDRALPVGGDGSRRGVRDHVPLDDVVARGEATVSAEHDAAAHRRPGAVDDVVGEPGPLRVGVELDRVGGRVVEEVVDDLAIEDVRGIDAVVVVAVLGVPALVERVSADDRCHGLAAALVVAQDQTAAPAPGVRDVRLLEHDPARVDLDRVGAVLAGPLDVEPGQRDVVGAVADVDDADQPGPLAGVAAQRERRARLAAAAADGARCPGRAYVPPWRQPVSPGRSESRSC